MQQVLQSTKDNIMSRISKEKMYFNGELVIEIFHYSNMNPTRNVYWEHMPFKQHDFVNHREHGLCLIWKIMSCGTNEGQLELATLKGMQRFHHGGITSLGSLQFRAEINEVDEIKFKNEKERKKYLQLNIQPYYGWEWKQLEKDDEWFKTGKHKEAA